MGGMARADRVRTGTNPTRRHSQSSITTRWLGQGEARNTRAIVECESETVSCEGKQVCKISGLRCLCTYLGLIVIGLKQGSDCASSALISQGVSANSCIARSNITLLRFDGTSGTYALETSRNF